MLLRTLAFQNICGIAAAVVGLSTLCVGIVLANRAGGLVAAEAVLGHPGCRPPGSVLKRRNLQLFGHSNLVFDPLLGFWELPS